MACALVANAGALARAGFLPGSGGFKPVDSGLFSARFSGPAGTKHPAQVVAATRFGELAGCFVKPAAAAGAGVVPEASLRAARARAVGLVHHQPLRRLGNGRALAGQQARDEQALIRSLDFRARFWCRAWEYRCPPERRRAKPVAPARPQQGASGKRVFHGTQRK